MTARDSGWPLDAESLEIVVDAVAEAAPQIAVEYGSGFSTVELAPHCRLLISLEAHHEYRDATAQLLADSDVDEGRVDLRLCEIVGGTYETELPDGIGFALIDGPRIAESRAGTLTQLWPHLASGAPVYVDDLHHAPVQRWVAAWEQQLRKRVVRISDRLGLFTR